LDLRLVPDGFETDAVAADVPATDELGTEFFVIVAVTLTVAGGKDFFEPVEFFLEDMINSSKIKEKILFEQTDYSIKYSKIKEKILFEQTEKSIGIQCKQIITAAYNIKRSIISNLYF